MARWFGWSVSAPTLAVSGLVGKILIFRQVREARKAGVSFDKERMRDQNCWIEEFEETEGEDSSIVSAPSASPPTSNGNGNNNPEPEPDLHQAGAAAHPLHHPLRHLHLLRRHRKQTKAPRYPPKEFLERSYTRGKIHDCLQLNNGIGHVGVLGWNVMEWLPFRRMDLQPDGSWKAISWPLPRGEVRDIPENVKIHCSVIKRMEADPT